jgi:peroxiredoxin
MRMLGLFVLLSSFSWSQAGKFNAILEVGSPAPAWEELPGVDGKAHSLTDLKVQDKPVVVVIFTCNSCPVAEQYEDRIIAFAKKYQEKVAVVAINVNLAREDKLDAMKQRAKKKQFNFDYLFDPTQKIARMYGAKYTPEFFVLDNTRKVAYLGAMDDKNNPADVKVNFLEAAVEATLAGKKVEVSETLARGCQIAFKRERKE